MHADSLSLAIKDVTVLKQKKRIHHANVVNALKTEILYMVAVVHATLGNAMFPVSLVIQGKESTVA